MIRFAKPRAILEALLVLGGAASVVRSMSRTSPPSGTSIDLGAPTKAITAERYKVDPDWPKTLPPGRPETGGYGRRMGSTNGDIAVSTVGEVYVGVEAPRWRPSVGAWGRIVGADDNPLPSKYVDPFAGIQCIQP